MPLCPGKGRGSRGAGKSEQGRALDEDGTAPGFAEAMTAVGEAYLDSGDQERADAVYYGADPVGEGRYLCI